MRKYLSTLHKRSPVHKKRFALFTSSVITLFIFTIWSVTNFSPKANQPLSNSRGGDLTTEEVSPLESLRANLALSFESIVSSFTELKSSFGPFDLDTPYQDLRDNALDIYGQ